MLNFLRKITPKFIISAYHYALSQLAALFYFYPSESMIVIGVTGTNGKTSTGYFIAQLLEASGFKTGLISTALIKIDQAIYLNDLKMTMPGRFKLQSLLSQMKKAGCRYVVVETSSQGLIQHRHKGINYDYAVFTNLTPEHIEAHGGFENYKKAKKVLFDSLAKSKKKNIDGRIVEKVIVANLDDEHYSFYLQSKAGKKIGFTFTDKHDAQLNLINTITELAGNKDGLAFNFEGTEFSAGLVGEFNAYNLAAALSVAANEITDLSLLQTAVKNIKSVPGRLEIINEGQDFTVIVDFAYEPFALMAVFKTLSLFPHKRVIHIVGSCGGGRDVARRPIMGKLGAENADIVIVTNDDPYDDDPMEIIDAVAHGAMENGKISGLDLFVVEDRKEAIEKAILMAEPDDLVLITGKGCDQYIMSQNGSRIPNDDRVEARKAIHNKQIPNSKK